MRHKIIKAGKELKKLEIKAFPEERKIALYPKRGPATVEVVKCLGPVFEFLLDGVNNKPKLYPKAYCRDTELEGFVKLFFHDSRTELIHLKFVVSITAGVLYSNEKNTSFLSIEELKLKEEINE